MLGIFNNGCLIITEDDKEFIGDEIIEEEVKVLSEDAMHAIKNKEENAATYAWAKDEHEAEAWMIEHECKSVRCHSELWSNKWIHNAAIASETTIILDLVMMVVKI